MKTFKNPNKEQATIIELIDIITEILYPFSEKGIKELKKHLIDQGFKKRVIKMIVLNHKNNIQKPKNIPTIGISSKVPEEIPINKNRISIDLTLRASRKISPLQAEKFVEESLHRFQKLLLGNLATRAEFSDFCESERECKNIHLSRQLPIYETSSVPDGTFQLSGYSDAPIDDIFPPNRKN